MSRAFGLRLVRIKYLNILDMNICVQYTNYGSKVPGVYIISLMHIMYKYKG